MDEVNVFDIASKVGNDRFGDISFIDWCFKYINILFKGKWRKFSFDEHEYLEDIYSLPDVPRETYQKPAQVGISIYSLLKTLFRGDRYAMKAAYYFPTDEDVRDFAQDRCDPIIDHSDYLLNKMEYDKADNLGLKQIGDSSIYFRGVVTKRKVKSIDADMIVKDEVDEADQENLVFAEDRLLHSIFKWIIELSQPSVPDFGINASFKKSDQRHRMFKCPRCGRWNNLVESFPKNLFHRGKDEKLFAWIGCTRCKAKLTGAISEWVAKYPQRSKEHVGFQLSQLFTSTVDATFIYKKQTSAVLTSEKKNISISIVGIPYRDSEMCPITDEIITESEGKKGFEKGARSSFMGIDVGDVCHVSVWGWTGYRLRLIYLEEVLADDEERFCEIIRQFNSYFVIDAMPYKTLAKNLAREFYGWGSIQYFKGNTLHEKTEGEGEYEVPVVMHDRTESIDEMADLLKQGFFILPNPKVLKSGELEVYERFKSQIKNLEKEKVQDKNGYTRTVYKKKVSNHFGMSMNSGFIAFRIGKGAFTPNVDPLFG